MALSHEPGEQIVKSEIKIDLSMKYLRTGGIRKVVYYKYKV